MIPKQLKEEKFRFNKLNEKIAIEKEWQNKNNYSYKDIKGNYGVVCGYGNLLVIDFDDKDFQLLIEPQLPETFTVKTAGKRLHHLYFICEAQPKTQRINNKDGKRIADLQGKGTYVVGANNIMKNGRKYEIIKNKPLAYITYSKIKEIFSPWWKNKEEQTKKNLKSMKGVSEGQRDEICFKKCCSYLSTGMNDEDVLDIVFTWNERNNPPLTKTEILKCFNSAKKYQKKESIKEKLKVFENDWLQLANELYKKQPFFYDKNNTFWLWNFNQQKYDLIDNVDLRDCLISNLEKDNNLVIKNKSAGEILKALQIIGRRNIPKIPDTNLIQFKDKVFNLETKEIISVDHEFFYTNPIPWEIGKSIDTPCIDKLFIDWLGEKNLITAYEIIAYCCYRDYPLHNIFCFVGSGRNGKSTFLNLLTKFLGLENTCSTDLDMLAESRFESFKLYKKLVCLLGETNFGILNRTSRIKKLCGQDVIGYEMKGKQPFDDRNYAKIIIASNSLPSSDDTSEGFYRRWIILNFKNNFPEGKDILKEVPNVEFENLAKKVVKILPNLLERHKFDNHGSIEQRKKDYIMASNPLPFFIEMYCEKGVDEYMIYSDLYTFYVNYLLKNKKRKVSRKEFRSALENEGLFISKTSKRVGTNEEGYGDFKTAYWIEGISLKK